MSYVARVTGRESGFASSSPRFCRKLPIAPASVAMTVIAQISMNTSNTRAPLEIGFLIEEDTVRS